MQRLSWQCILKLKPNKATHSWFSFQFEAGFSFHTISFCKDNLNLADDQSTAMLMRQASSLGISLEICHSHRRQDNERAERQMWMKIKDKFLIHKSLEESAIKSGA